MNLPPMIKNMDQKLLLAGVVVFVLLIIGGMFAFAKFGNSKPTETAQETPKKKKKIGISDNIIAVADRPYLRLLPLSDGRNIIIEATEIKKEATQIEYELEYQAGSLLQGAFGAIELVSNGAAKPQAKILFGSCSAGGACTYHEDVKGGTLRAILTGGAEDYAVKSEWNYLINGKRASKHQSKDELFTITGDNLAKQSYLIIYTNAGYPTGLSAEPVSAPYSVTTTSALTGKGTVTIQATETPTAIMGWNGSSWETFSGTVQGATITAQVDLMDLYIAVK